TTPAPSWPISEGAGHGMVPSRRLTSLWHTPAAASRTSTSLGPGSITSTSLRTSAPSPVNTIPRMRETLPPGPDDPSDRRLGKRPTLARMSARVATLVSVNVGMPREVNWQGWTVVTGIWKEAVQGPRRVRRLNVDGDGQGDLAGHGGEQRAVYVYQLDSYRYWGEQLHRDQFVFGQFGENFTVDGLGDDEVCVGDRYRIGSARFEVTQPRVTCYRVGIRMDEPRMPALLTASGRPGFYLRVLQEGEVGAGDEIVKVGEASERMTVAEINALLYSRDHSRDRLERDRLERALRIEALSPGWRSSFEALLQSRTAGAESGNAGLAPAAAAHPVAPGFRSLLVTAVDHESK